MTKTDPAAALNGIRTGHICDRCNRGLRSGDGARFYATRYEDTGWTLRRLYCSDCGETKIESGTAEADEVVGEAVFWNHRLAGVGITDRSRPTESEVTSYE